MTDEAIKRISKAKVQLLSTDPFLSAVLMGLRFAEATAEDGIDTMATDGAWLWWNREFTMKLTMAELQGVLLHEAAHVILLHMLRIGKRSLGKWNKAADYAINLLLGNYTLPTGALLDAQYRGLTAEQVYDRLPDEDDDGQSASIGGVLPATNEDGSEMSEAEAKVFEEQVKARVIQAAEYAKSVGKLSSAQEAYVNNLKQSQVDWRSKLRRLFAGANPEDFSMRRPNRVFMSHGMYLPGIHRQGVGHVAIALDTSGSVSEKEMAAFWSEIVSICEETSPDLVTVIHCDAAIQRVDEYYSGDIPTDIKRYGRGGTTFDLPFEYVEENYAAPDMFIYLTDGECSFPSARSYPVIWAMTKKTPAPWGDTVHIKV